MLPVLAVLLKNVLFNVTTETYGHLQKLWMNARIQIAKGSKCLPLQSFQLSESLRLPVFCLCPHIEKLNALTKHCTNSKRHLPDI